MLALETHDIPFSFWVWSAVVLLGGFGLIVWSAWMLRRHKRTEKAGTFVALRWFVISDVLRDIGIACLVAIVVTAVYEVYTREIFEGAKLQQVLKTVLTYNVPGSVWSELNQNILYRHAIRRKAEVTFKVEKDPSFYGNLARLRMDYSYYLYRLGAGSSVDVQHDVVRHMIFKDYPRFESVSVTEPGREPVTCDRECLKREGKLHSFKTKFYMEPSYDFGSDTYDDSKAARIHSVRDEVISLPGVYPLGIPEVIEGPINVSVLVPDGVEPEIDAQWGQHVFGLKGTRPVEGGYTEHKYTFEGTLLPGQTILVLFKVPNSPMPPTPDETAKHVRRTAPGRQ